jgi:WD40 repeat protein
MLKIVESGVVFDEQGQAQVESVCFNETGTLLLASVSQLFVKKWVGCLRVFKNTGGDGGCTFTLQQNVELPHGNAASAVFLKSAKKKEPEMVVSASDSGEIHLWSCDEDAWNFAAVNMLSGHDDMILNLCTGGPMSPSCFFSASQDRTVKLWSAALGKCVRTFSGHSAPCLSVSACFKSTHLSASGGMDRSLMLWDSRDSNPIGKISLGSAVHSVEWDQAYDNIVACGQGNGEVCVYDIRTPFQPLSSTNLHKGTVAALSCRTTTKDEKNGSECTSMFACGGDDLNLSVFSSQVQQVPESASGGSAHLSSTHRDYIRCVAWSPDGTRFVSGSWDGSAKIFDVEAHC